MNAFAKKLMVGASVAALVLSMGSTGRAQGKDIVDTAVGAGQFKTLAAALGAAGLVETLKGAGPFTVFAPTDAAFAKLPAGTVEMLLKPENKAKLTAILTYHVVAGKVMAADVVKVTSAKTVQGGSVAVKVTGGKVTIDAANVVTTDIAASNGVIPVHWHRSGAPATPRPGRCRAPHSPRNHHRPTAKGEGRPTGPVLSRWQCASLRAR